MVDERLYIQQGGYNLASFILTKFRSSHVIIVHEKIKQSTSPLLDRYSIICIFSIK